MIIWDVQEVEIIEGRWNVTFVISTSEGTKTFIASADSAFTEGSGIWFGTEEEYEHDLERL